MANQEHVEILKQGVDKWNKWRKENPQTDIDLNGAFLRKAYLREADLKHADLSGAYLIGADLYGANLFDANLSGAKLYGATLSGANLSKANLIKARFPKSSLNYTKLVNARLINADLYGSLLYRTDHTPILRTEFSVFKLDNNASFPLSVKAISVSLLTRPLHDWIPFWKNLPNVPVTDIEMAQGEQVIYAATRVRLNPVNRLR